MNSDDGFPSLTCKAYNGRLFLVFLTTCLSALRERSDDLEVRLALTACRSFCVFFDRIERCGRYLSPNEGREIKGAIRTFLTAYESLARLNVAKGIQRFKLIPKMHILMHLGEDCAHFLYNCRYHHCYRDEDMVGVMKRLAEAVHKGPLMEFRILTRYLLRLGSWTPGIGL